MITLTKAEIAIAKYLAKSRYAVARSKGRENKKIGDQSNEMTDLEGIGAELAFCRMMNIYPDLDIGHTPTFDATGRDGIRYDVKSTRYRNGHLLAAPWKGTAPAEVYVLMVGEFPGYECAGYLPASVLLKMPKKDFGHGPGFAATQKDLFNPEELANYMEKCP